MTSDRTLKAFECGWGAGAEQTGILDSLLLPGPACPRPRSEWNENGVVMPTVLVRYRGTSLIRKQTGILDSRLLPGPASLTPRVTNLTIRGNDLKGFKVFYLKAKARIWP